MAIKNVIKISIGLLNDTMCNFKTNRIWLLFFKPVFKSERTRETKTGRILCIEMSIAKE